MQLLHFEDFIEFLEQLHGEAFLPEVVIALDDDVDELVAWQVAVGRGLDDLLVL